MNKYMMLQLADFLDTLGENRFNLGSWVSTVEKRVDSNGEINHKFVASYYDSLSSLDINNCGTAGCLAGWAVAMCSNLKFEKLRTSQIQREAEKILDLNSTQASALFFYDDRSIWFSERIRLGLQTVNKESDCCCLHSQHYCGSDIDPDDVTSEMAAMVLRDIVSGRVHLTDTNA